MTGCPKCIEKYASQTIKYIFALNKKKNALLKKKKKEKKDKLRNRQREEEIMKKRWCMKGWV